MFDTQVVDIAVFDHEDGTMRVPVLRRARGALPGRLRPIMGFRKHVLETKQPLLIADNS